MSLRYVDPNDAIRASMAIEVVSPQLAVPSPVMLSPALPRGSLADPLTARAYGGPMLRGLGRLAALGEEPRTASLPGFARPVSGPVPNPDTFRRIKIAEGARGTTQTLEQMAELAVEASQDPYFVQFARGVVRECGGRDHVCEARAILEWAKREITYRHDPALMEYLQSPAWTAFVDGAGDCDDGSSLISAMALSVGLGTMFRAVALNKANPKEFTHVYPMIKIPGRGWFAADFVPPTVQLGWEPPKELWVMAPNELVMSEG